MSQSLQRENNQVNKEIEELNTSLEDLEAVKSEIEEEKDKLKDRVKEVLKPKKYLQQQTKHELVSNENIISKRIDKNNKNDKRKKVIIKSLVAK